MPRETERRDAEALIKEARRRRRRRYLLIGLGLCVVAAAVAVGLAVTGGRGGRPVSSSAYRTPRSVPPAALQRQAGVSLPSSALFNRISVTPEGLLLAGVTPATANSLTPTCAAASLDPQTLRVGTLVTGSCNDPRFSGRTVEAINSNIPQSNNATISISSVSPSTGKVILGPVVMTYGSYSDTRPLMTYGSEWLWIYDVDSTLGPELLQVSIQSGAVVDAIPMPKLYRPILAADDGGVWVANSIQGSPGPALSYVASGASAPIIVVPDSGLPICWLTAGATTAWVGAGVGWDCGKQVVEEYVDGTPGPLYSTPGSAGVIPFYVIGDNADGLWAMQWTKPVSPGTSSPQQIISVDSATGTESVVATLPPVVYPIGAPSGGLVQGQGVHFDGALYLLEPPFRERGYLGYTSIVRIPVHQARS